jgi:hypothetical protein
MIRKIATVSTATVFIGSALVARAEPISSLKVIQDAAQTGMWTSVLSGHMTDGSPVPKKTETFCATKAEILDSFSQALYYDNKTREEDKGCPTVISTNTSTLGVAKATCPAQTHLLAGTKIEIPSTTVIAEYKRINKNQWTIKFGTMLSTITFHGSATANCVNGR